MIQFLGCFDSTLGSLLMQSLGDFWHCNMTWHNFTLISTKSDKDLDKVIRLDLMPHSWVTLDAILGDFLLIFGWLLKLTLWQFWTSVLGNFGAPYITLTKQLFGFDSTWKQIRSLDLDTAWCCVTLLVLKSVRQSSWLIINFTRNHLVSDEEMYAGWFIHFKRF